MIAAPANANPTTEPATPAAAPDDQAAPADANPTTEPAAGVAVPDDPTASTSGTDDQAAPVEEDSPKTNAVKAAVAKTADAFTSWWGFVARPMSIREAWRLSGVIDARRIPDRSNLLANLWWIANRTERILLFLLVLVLTFVLGSILWCSVTPTRRLGLYTVVFPLLAIFYVAAKG